MIQEDYVSFEIAKLLKEKGFDVYGDGSFGSSTKIWMEYSPFGKFRDISTTTPSIKGFPAPTHQMAMKWLREEYGISIEISALNRYRYVYTIYRLFEERVVEVWNDGTYVSYENATDDALKYCLENLNKFI